VVSRRRCVRTIALADEEPDAEEDDDRRKDAANDTHANSAATHDHKNIRRCASDVCGVRQVTVNYLDSAGDGDGRDRGQRAIESGLTSRSRRLWRRVPADHVCRAVVGQQCTVVCVLGELHVEYDVVVQSSDVLAAMNAKGEGPEWTRSDVVRVAVKYWLANRPKRAK
jgi:hypothetical protein